MAVTSVIFLLLISINNLLQINCEPEWRATAFEFGTPELYQQQDENNNEIKNLLGQVVTLLQNMTATMNTVVSVLENQQEILLLDSPHDCSDLASRGDYPTGPYTIAPWVGLNYDIDVYCDMDTDGGEWTVFQRRFDGTTNFYRGWNEYENGFGNSDSEFWAGLKLLHLLTRTGNWILRIDLEDFEGSKAYSLYDSFQIGDAESNYTLSIGSYQEGRAGDSMRSHDLNNMQFTTYDRDNDVYGNVNCADHYQGAWWYRSCSYTNLNGLYLGPTGTSQTGMTWSNWKPWQSLKRSEMKIRQVQ